MLDTLAMLACLLCPCMHTLRGAAACSLLDIFPKEQCMYLDFAGGRRVLRLLQTLKVASLGAHYDLLLSIARQRPNLASAYLVSCQLGMDPKPSLKWLASMSVLGSLMQLSQT